MIMLKFSPTDIVSIKVYDKKHLIHWGFINSRPIKKFFGLWDTGQVTQEGFINNSVWQPKMLTKGDISDKYNNLQVINDKVYRKPSLEITLSSGESIIEYFDTLPNAHGRKDELELRAKKEFLMKRE